MAINKTSTSPAMKAGVIMLIVAFVAGIGVIGIGALDSSGGGSTTAQQTTNTGSTQLDQISQSALATISPVETQLKSNPNDYNLLKRLGDDYYDYASQVAQAAPNAGLDLTIWRQSADYYKRALTAKPGDPNVSTDMSIAQFYSGDTSAAVATVEAVRKADPTFAPAIYNAGIFYKSAGENAKAIAAFQDYLKAAPNGPSAANAKQQLSQLQSGSSSTSSSGQ